ncbi:MAG: DUF3098 domain-containing protein [Rhodothermales bacterium]
MAKRRARKRTSRRRGARQRVRMVFERKNYVLLLSGLAAIVVGYVMMRVDNQVDGFISLYVAPLFILGGYLEIFWAILATSDDDVATPSTTEGG